LSRLLHRYANRTRADLVGRVAVGPRDIAMVSHKDILAGLIGGHSLLEEENSCDRILPLMAALANKAYACTEQGNRKLPLYKDEWDSEENLNKLVGLIETDLGRGRVVVRKTKAANHKEPEPVEYDGSLKNSELRKGSIEYIEQLSEVPEHVEKIVDRAKILCRRKLINDMWGAPKTQEVIDGVKKTIADLEESCIETSKRVSLSRKAVERLCMRLCTKTILESDKKYINQVLVPEVLGNFQNIVSAVSMVVGALYPLKHIDKIFKENTGNPASWFLPSNIIDDLDESYDVLVDFLYNLPKFENGVMIPLEYLKHQEA
jgi:hypothetical protein